MSENDSFLKKQKQVTIIDAHDVENDTSTASDGEMATPVFAELMVYTPDHNHWMELSRWVRYEESVEAGSGRWNSVLDVWIKSGKLRADDRSDCKNVLMMPKQHQHEQIKEDGGVKSAFNKPKPHSALFDSQQMGPKISRKQNKSFSKKLPSGCVGATILAGNAVFVDQQLFALIRLKEAVILPEITEVNIPCKFLVFIMSAMDRGCKGVGRATGSILADELFRNVSQNCLTKEELIVGLDAFLEETTVLNPSSWDPKVRLKPLAEMSSRKRAFEDEQENYWEEHGSHASDPALKYTGRPFGGLVEDVKRKLPFYLSDFKDGFSLKSLSTFCFMYFAILSPIITFGGLYEEATDQRLAVIENILGACFCGMTFHLFSGQPLTIIGATGPILVCETLIYEMCKKMEIDYLSFRFWMCVWIAILAILIVATDFSVVVKYITRFTEESFATLIAIIFIWSCINKLQQIYENDKQYSLYDKMGYEVPQDALLLHSASHNPDKDLIKSHNWTESTKTLTCYCAPNNESSMEWFLKIVHRRHWTDEWLVAQPWYWVEGDSHNETITHIDYSLVPPDRCHLLHGQIVGEACFEVHNRFFMSLLLTVGTFTIAMFLSHVRNTSFFPVKMRTAVSDFAISLSVLAMVAVDWTLHIATDKLYPTYEGRSSFLVDPFLNEFWTIVFAFLPGLFMIILIFMDQQITTVILNRAENKLKKGAGYHLDMLIIAVQVFVCGSVGWPIFVSETVTSMNHVNSLKMNSATRVPGEAPMFIGCLEQRVTGLLTFACIGLTVFLAPVLKHIPLAVLYGVFLYMGVNALNGLQLFDRILLMFVPSNDQPDYAYLRNVKIARVHFFTIIQLIMFALLLFIKSTKQIALAFPIMLVVIVIIRYLLNFVFTSEELGQLDDELPELFVRRKQDKLAELNLPKRRGMSVSSLIRGGVDHSTQPNE